MWSQRVGLKDLMHALFIMLIMNIQSIYACCGILIKKNHGYSVFRYNLLFCLLMPTLASQKKKVILDAFKSTICTRVVGLGRRSSHFRNRMASL